MTIPTNTTSSSTTEPPPPSFQPAPSTAGLGRNQTILVVASVAIMFGLTVALSISMYRGSLKGFVRRQALKGVASVLRNGLPRKISDKGSMTDVRVEGDELVFEIEMNSPELNAKNAESIAAMRDEFSKSVALKICGDPAMLKQINDGAIVTYDILNANHEPLFKKTVRKEDCVGREGL